MHSAPGHVMRGAAGWNCSGRRLATGTGPQAEVSACGDAAWRGGNARCVFIGKEPAGPDVSGVPCLLPSFP